jgi:hypothetical protein
MNERIVGASSGTREELVERGEGHSDLQSDATMPELAVTSRACTRWPG